MQFYAERPLRVARQMFADVLVVVWTAFVVVVARAAYDLVQALQRPARTLVDAGDAIRGTFDGAARTAAGVPLIGDDLARTLGRGTDAGVSLAEAGRTQADVITNAAWGLAVAIVVVLAVPVVLAWVALRVRYARAAGSAIAARTVDPDLLAVRALARQPMHRLRRVAVDPAGAWRRGDPAAVQGLAALELRSLGLRAPAP